MEVFYYDRRQLLLWLAFNALLLLMVVLTGQCCPLNLGLISVAAFVCLISFSASLYVVLFPQKLTQINHEGIKIDHNALLKWEDIAKAEKVMVHGLGKREIILFTLKDEGAYRLTLTQKLTRKSPYGAFSIPLYAMTASDADKIFNDIEKYISIVNNVKK